MIEQHMIPFIVIGVLALAFIILLIKYNSLKLKNTLFIEKFKNEEARYNQLETTYNDLRSNFKFDDDAKKQQLDELKMAFQSLSEEVLEKKSEKFHNMQSSTLTELKQDIEKFRNAFTETSKDEYSQRGLLIQEINNLKSLNIKMSEDALNLTKALKNDSKVRGNWGEMILEQLLQNSGLREDETYFLQQGVINSDGNRLIPDVLIKLPNDKCIIIDSKVNLVDYEKYVNSDDETARIIHLKHHKEAIMTHVKSLSSKDYTKLRDVEGLDFVIMFIPLEGAVAELFKGDVANQLYYDAYKSNVMIATPSTLMPVLRVIGHLWRNEMRDKNIREIIEQAENLLTKFQAFIKHMTNIEKGLDNASKAYDDAIKSMQTGKGSLISRVEKLSNMAGKKLDMPDKYIQAIESIDNEKE